VPLGIHRERRLDALILKLTKESPPPLCQQSLEEKILKKANKKQQKNSASSRAATSRRRRRRSALCLFLSSIMAGVDLAMEGIPRYVKDLFFFFFCLSRRLVRSAKDVFKINNNMRFSSKIRLLSVFGMSFSPRMRALNVYKLFSAVVFFQKQIRKTCALQRYENNRGSGIFKTAAIYVLRKEKRLLTTGQITR
jgi:hypothetical protein